MDVYGQNSSSESDEEPTDIIESDDESVICISEDSEDEPWINFEPEPDVECSVWDKDCVISNIRPSGDTIQGYHLMPTCVHHRGENLAKRKKISVDLNQRYTVEEFKKKLKHHFLNDISYGSESHELITDPWKVLILDDVIDNVDILNEIRQEFSELDWNLRHMDLYNFLQSDDLKFLEHKYLKAFHRFLKYELKEWVQNLTGFEFCEVSATCSCYCNEDFLLPHDDQSGNRAVAFVFYLTGNEGWHYTWGGKLDLFDRDEDGQPRDCTRQINPRNNQLVLFPVSEQSYHQVSEVVCKNFSRLSINGWFHVKEPIKFDTPIYKQPLYGIHSNSFDYPNRSDISLKDWIDSYYLSSNFGENFEDTSEISLLNFFKAEVVERIEKALTNQDSDWLWMGPPNRYNYQYLEYDDMPFHLKNFIDFLKSSTFLSFIERSIEIRFERMRWEFQRWTPKCYSLLTAEPEYKQLDLYVYFGDVDVTGGVTSYVTLDEEVQTTLTRVVPYGGGTANFIYGDVAKYTSYVPTSCKSKCFYVLVMSYLE